MMHIDKATMLVAASAVVAMETFLFSPVQPCVTAARRSIARTISVSTETSIPVYTGGECGWAVIVMGTS